MANLFYLPYRPIHDGSGLVAPGAKVLFTQNGSNTLKPVYSNSGLSVQLSNPVAADGVGTLPTIYMDPAITYRVRIYAKNATPLVDSPIKDFNPYVPGFFADAGALQPVADAAEASATAASDSAAEAADSVADAAAIIAAADLAGIEAAQAALEAALAAGGSDVALRADLALGTGAQKVGFTPAWTGAALRTLFERMKDWVSVKDFGAIGNGVADDTAAIQAALNYINSIGGGTLYFPAGTYKVTAYLTIYKKTVIRGAGRAASTLTTAMAGGGGASTDLSVRNGSMFYSNWPSNNSTPVDITIEHIAIINTNGANVGAAFYDNGGTYISIRECTITGFKHGVIFDQSELCDVDLCNFSQQTVAGVWLANGADLRAGNAGFYTNRISVKRCQLNEATTAYGILDDGGYVHSFTDNNYNGCLNHIRAACTTGLNIIGGEFESAAGACIAFSASTLLGSAGGSCVNVYLGGGATLLAVAGQPCIAVSDLGNIVLDAVYFSSSVTAFTGTVNTNAIYSTNSFKTGSGALFASLAANHWETGYNGTDFGARTTLPLASSAAITSTGGGIGYAVGAGGSVTQATSKSTAVILNKLSGQITMNGAALGANTAVSFTLTNSMIEADDEVQVWIKSGATANAYIVRAQGNAAGSREIMLYHFASGSLSEAVVLGFSVKKAAIT